MVSIIIYLLHTTMQDQTIKLIFENATDLLYLYHGMAQYSSTNVCDQPT
jgi:hypothetical protein